MHVSFSDIRGPRYIPKIFPRLQINRAERTTQAWCIVQDAFSLVFHLYISN